MNATSYILLSLVVFILLLYPLIRKAVSLLEIFVNKYIQTAIPSENTKESKPTSQTLLNLKLLAYERIILLIERLKPDSLIPRTLSSAATCKEYQLLLLNEIRHEFEYNLSQQLYLSENAWNITVNFKDSIIALINSAATDCAAEATPRQLGKKILERYITSGLQADQILRQIKADIF